MRRKSVERSDTFKLALALSYRYMLITFTHDTRPIYAHIVSIFPFLFAYLQFIPDRLTTKIRHSHDLNNQASPASEVLSPLPLASLWVILLPGEACLLPALIDGVDKVLAKVGVELLSAFLVRPLCLGDILGLSVTKTW